MLPEQQNITYGYEYGKPYGKEHAEKYYESTFLSTGDNLLSALSAGNVLMLTVTFPGMTSAYRA
jgi:hypothetical protein